MSSALEVQIMPTTGSLYQQGFDIDTMEVEPGETFKIDKKYQGSVSCEDEHYIFWDREEFTDRKELVEGEDTYLLRPGSYLFHEDGVTIEKLK